MYKTCKCGNLIGKDVQKCPECGRDLSATRSDLFLDSSAIQNHPTISPSGKMADSAKPAGPSAAARKSSGSDPAAPSPSPSPPRPASKQAKSAPKPRKQIRVQLKPEATAPGPQAASKPAARPPAPQRPEVARGEPEVRIAPIIVCRNCGTEFTAASLGDARCPRCTGGSADADAPQAPERTKSLPPPEPDKEVDRTHSESAGAASPRPQPPDPAPKPAVPDEPDIEKTMLGLGIPVPDAIFMRRVYYLDVLGDDNRWKAVSEVVEAGLEIGRTHGHLKFEQNRSLAARHARLAIAGDRIMVHDLGSRNGIFQRVKQHRLSDGEWLRIGSHLMEYRGYKVDPPADTAGSDEEILWCSLLPAHGLIAVKQPNGSELVFPLVKSVTRIGRDPNRADIVLTDDKASSRLHAEIALEEGALWLRDLDSQNGTYVRLECPQEVEPDTWLLLGSMLVRIRETGFTGE